MVPMTFTMFTHLTTSCHRRKTEEGSQEHLIFLSVSGLTLSFLIVYFVILDCLYQDCLFCHVLCLSSEWKSPCNHYLHHHRCPTVVSAIIHTTKHTQNSIVLLSHNMTSHSPSFIFPLFNEWEMSTRDDDDDDMMVAMTMAFWWFVSLRLTLVSCDDTNMLVTCHTKETTILVWQSLRKWETSTTVVTTVTIVDGWGVGCLLCRCVWGYFTTTADWEGCLSYRLGEGNYADKSTQQCTMRLLSPPTSSPLLSVDMWGR